MSRKSFLVRIVAAVVGVVAIGFAAASVESPVETGGSGGVGEGEGSGISDPSEPVANPDAVSDVPPFLEYLGLILLVLVAVSIAWYLLTNRRQLVKMVAIYLLIAAIVVAFAWILLEFGFPEPQSDQPAEQANATEPGSEGFGSGESDQRDTFPISFGPLLLVIGLVAAVFGGAFVLSKRDATATDDGLVSSSDPTDDAAAIGVAAGRAADRIDETNDEGVDNAVYRAWRDMTRHLEVDRPETSTPREFASAAASAGIAKEHVDELTSLFEEVRYGHADTTPERETRAETVLRRIESAYADGADDERDGPRSSQDTDPGSATSEGGENE